MSQFQQQTHQGSPASTLDFDSLMDHQRRMLKDLSPSKLSNVNETKPENTVAENSDDLSSGDEEEWISNWQFERIASNKKTTGINSISTSTNIKSKSKATAVENEGGVFYFQRIQPSFTAPAISSNPSVISTSDTDDAVASRQFIADDNQKHDFDQHDFLLDMTIDNDDLFADLEAAADSNGDSEISLDDLMEMEIEDDQQVHDHDDNLMRSLHANQTSGLHDVNDFLNKSTSAASTALMDDDDFEMTSNDSDENVYSFSSPITSKGNVSSSMHFGSLPISRSPTSVAHRMPPPPLMQSSCSMSSASTRPALQQMRKMMTDLMDSGAMPRSCHDSRLPCAEGMDDMYLDTLRKLSASMERSKKTRQSLSIPMQNVESSTHYSRSMCVNQILHSVNNSSRNVDACLRNVSMLGR